MTERSALRTALGGWLLPIVHLSNNVLSLLGVVLVMTATVFWIFLLPTSLGPEVHNPYMGILVFLLLPAVFFLGLGLIPVGLFFRFRKERKRGSYPANFPALNFRNVEFRRLLLFVVGATLVNIVIAGEISYSAVNYMEGVTFCGRTCHTVMEPEYAAYQNSPHSRVECVKCHIGPGASWFVRSKLSGMGQVFAVTFNTYERPIPTPVRNLRPARETCEACHWPQKFGEDRLRIIEKYGDDERNTVTRTVLLMRIGGGKRGPGIHGTHLGPGVTIRYKPADATRQTIPWVEYTDARGNATAYTAKDAKPEAIKNLPEREMDCMDCHNRPTHAFALPDPAVDQALSAGDISASLPYIKKKAVELLKTPYLSNQAAASAIPAALAKYYRENYAEVYGARRADIERSAGGVVAIYNRNVFPAMKLTWGNYPNNVGHTDFPGCFRCHDDQHVSAKGSSVTQDCNSCHQMLAMDEAAPKILTDLGMGPAPAKQ
jgi:nitrate/TMAO reductase-like tetraheme cytochrome c subunit